MKWYISWHNTSDIKRVDAFANTMRIQSKQYDEAVEIEKWGQIQRIELVNKNDFIETLIKC